MGYIPRTDRSWAVHLHKMFRKLLCYFGGFILLWNLSSFIAIFSAL